MDEPTQPLAPARPVGSDINSKSTPTPRGLHPADARTTLLPAREVRKRPRRRMRVLLYSFLLLFLVVGGVLVYGFIYFQNNINQPVQQFIRTVSRSNDEPPVND